MPDDEARPAGPPGVPPWVRVFGVVALLGALVLVLVLLLSRGQHGPGRHSPDSTVYDVTAASHGLQREAAGTEAGSA